MKHNYKTAIITYPNSNNLGDYIQKIASKQFLNEDIISLLDTHAFPLTLSNLIKANF